MTAQGPGDGPDNAREDETRTDWGNLAGDAATPPPVPDAPPPPTGELLPADADVPAPGTPLGAAQPPAGSTPPPPVASGGPPVQPPAQPPAPPPPRPAGAPPGGPAAWAPAAWAPTAAAPTGLEVPGAPGLRFGGVLGRVLAYWLDGILVGLGAGLVAGIIGEIAGSGRTASLITAVVYLGLEFLYFVGLWTSSGRATLGMRLMKMQIGNAFDGRTLTMTQATLRWAALGLPFQAVYLLPPPASAIGGLLALWLLVLLVSTAISPTRQGLHDRIANSAIVQPIGASTPAVACLVVLLLLVVVPIIAIIALIFLGGQVSTILSETGTSVY